MKSLRFLKANPWIACYDNEPAGGADGGGAGGGTGDNGGNPPPKTFTQDQVNGFLNEQKKKWQRQADTDRQNLIKQLETIQADKSTSDEAKAQLESQLEELRQANLSAEEKAGLALKKAEKEAGEKLSAAEQVGKTWQDRHNNLMVGYEISTNFGGDDIVPGSLEFVESYLRPRSRLVEDVDPDTNKGTGSFKVKVKMTVTGKDGKPTELDLTVAEAKKAMKDDVEKFGFLFKSTAAGGLGAGAGTPGKKPNVATMSPAQYMELRKKNPASLGLRTR